MEIVLRPLLVSGSVILATFAVGWAADFALRQIASRHPAVLLWPRLRRCRVPLQVAACTALLLSSYQTAGVGRGHHAGIDRALTLLLIASVGWLIVRIAGAIVESGYAHYASVSHDAARVRRVQTQVTLIQRVVIAVVAAVTGAVMLMQFRAMQTLGTSVLASAGVIAAVAGIAAQSTLGNLFAGLQIAFGDMVRLGDTVVVEGEWGTVEEITLTYLVVRTWDERRITMPVSYFTNRPFQNWSRGGAQMTGTVYLHLDHATPVTLLRQELHRVLKNCDAWDGRAWNLVVTDTTPSTIQVRALATARDADDLWTVRCVVREKLIGWLQEQHPYALPKISHTLAAPEPAHAPESLPDRAARH
ncbi:mechanosensitive ion channel family protein [Streptomyces sp. NPDC001691]|uniref:mechanosensitive ion channel family protein n=1 Tax=unclassified Streptomyces TaxID=2593676 RepID=UPI000DE8CE1C|nr:mechanosensitive ion channel domain-containing protein [Streptomyces sp. SDr-06]RCH67524.1 mechanosensitive ion channel family protein [Streptomyces sp. SDr-06]